MSTVKVLQYTALIIALVFVALVLRDKGILKIGAIAAPTATPIVIPVETPPVQQNFPITTTRSLSGKYYDITLKITAVHSPSAKTTIDGFVDSTIDSFVKDGNFDNLTPEDITMNGFDQGRKWTLDFTGEEFSNQKTSSYIIRTSNYTGGAHEGNDSKTFVFSKDKDMILLLSDIMKVPESQYLKVISDLALIKFQKELGPDFFKEGIAPQTDNWANWYIDTNNTLTFIFPPYQVAPFSSGEQSITFTADELKDIVKSDYL